jgi:signal transduction histidine kinase
MPTGSPGRRTRRRAFRASPFGPGADLLRPVKRNDIASYAVSVAAVVAAIALRLLLDPLLGDRANFHFLFAAVVFVAWYAGRGPALCTLLAGALGSFLVLLPPRFTPWVEDPLALVPLVLYVGVGLGAIALFESLRKARRRAEERQQRLAFEVRARAEAERVLSESEQRFRALHALSGRLQHAGDMESGLRDVLQHAVAACGADFGNIQRYDPRLAALEIVVQQGFDAAFLAHFRTVRVDEGSACARVLQAGERIVVEDVELDPDFAPHRPVAAAAGFRAVQSTPLRVHDGRIVGILSTHFRAPHRLPARDAQVLDLYARHAADLISRLDYEHVLAEGQRRKDEFLALLAHELRNPLAPMSHALRVMRRASADADLAAQAQAVMERQLRHLVRLVDDLLDVGRIASDKLELRTERLELATVVRDAVDACRPQLEAGGHALGVELPVMPIPLRADPVRLAQVIGNLLANACKFSEPGGRIQLSAEVGLQEVAIRVRDGGCGIAPELLPRIFDMFVQADRTLGRSHGGLGIGLSLVKRFTEMHGGRVSAHSEGEGRGSEFTVHLPLSDEAHAVPALARPPLSDGRAAPRRVLVVDDNHDGAEMLAALLREEGHETLTAHDGPQALAHAAAFRPHAVLLDLGLPTIDGFEVCRRLRRQPECAGTVVLALTGWGQAQDRRRTAEAGFDGHLVKPVESAALLHALAGALRPC